MDKHYWFVILAGILYGGIVFGGGILVDMGLSLYQIAIIPGIVGLIITLPLFLTKKRYLINKKMMKFYLLFAFVSSFGFLAQYASIILGVPVSIVVSLLYTQPLWTVIFSKIFLKENITKTKILAVFIVLLGIIIIINPLKIENVGSLTGIIIALIGGLSFSGWTILGSISGKRGYDPITTLVVGNLLVILVVLMYYPFISHFFQNPQLTSFSFNIPAKVWFYMTIIRIFTVLIPHILYYTGTRKVSTTDAGIILLLEPLSATILAAVFLGQSITINVIIGGILILFSNYLAIKEKD